jgi:hypothetical protein
MKFGSGALLVVVGLAVLWMAITGRLGCVGAFMGCVRGNGASGGTGKGASGTVPAPNGGSIIAALRPLPTLPTVNAWQMN